MIQFHKNTSISSHQPAKSTGGFTVIELLLAMGGIAFLLLFIVFAIVHMTNLYSKGTAIRQINQIGRQLSDEISRELRYGGKPKVLTANNRICVGNKSYMWNKKGTLATDANANKTATNVVIGFVRLDDSSYCDLPLKPVPTVYEEVLGNVAALMDMRVEAPAPIENPGVYEFTMILGTALEQPTYKISSGLYECNVPGAQFCAVGEFKATIYARKR